MDRIIMSLPFVILSISIITGFSILLPGPQEAIAAVEIIKFDDRQKESLYKELILELRCLVCQNQNLADSNAELAKDLRRKTHEMVAQGKSRKEIVDYMVTRYGEFVLYRPPLNQRTLILWFSPLVLFIVAFGLIIWSRKRKKIDNSIFTADELKEAHNLLGLASESPSAATPHQNNLKNQ